MSIAEKLIAIAENEQKVYDAGFAAGQAAGGGEDLFLSVTNINSLFSHAKFPDGYELTLNLPAFRGEANSAFRYTTGVKKITVKGSLTTGEISLQYTATGTSAEIIDLTQLNNGELPVTYGISTFDSSALHTVLGVFDFSKAVNVNGMFGGAMREFRWKAGTLSKSIAMKYCSNLTDETIQSVVDGLADLTDGTAQTLTLHAAIGAKLSEEQKAAVTAKNWTLVY